MKLKSLVLPFNHQLRIICKNYSIRQGTSEGIQKKENDREDNFRQLSPSDEKKKLLIQMEMNFERDAGNFLIPDSVPDKHWPELLKLETPQDRKRFYKYLKKTEIYEKKDQQKRQVKVLERKAKEEKMDTDNSGHIQYGLYRNTLFLRLLPMALNRPYQNNLRDAVLFGQKLVFDVGYEEMMNSFEIQNTIDQINISYGYNKVDREPYYMHICNINMKGKLYEKLKLSLPFLQKPDPLVTVTEKSYLDMFPKEKLVYLTSHCEVDLKTYSHDDIYIIGGLVDRNRQGPVSLAKAKKEGLRMARFPLEKFLNWSCGIKSLTIDQVAKILLTMKSTMDWGKAFEHVPTRKLKPHIPFKQSFPYRDPRH